jgi:hypothetical protein
MFKLKSLVLATTLAISGAAIASDVPFEKAFPDATQLKAMSVQHWTVMADDMAASVITSLGDRAARGIYVTAGESASPFAAQLAQFMKDSALKAGAKVFSKPKDGVLTLDVSTMVAVHRSSASPWPPVGAMTLATGLVVLRDIAVDSWRAGLMVAGAALDAARFVNKETSRAELAVSVSVQDGDQYVARKTNVYYLDQADLGLFAPTAGKTLKVEGDK